MWQRLLQVWGLDHGFVAAAIGQWRRRLGAYVKAREDILNVFYVRSLSMHLIDKLFLNKMLQ
jgi:hypothetical protein